MLFRWVFLTLLLTVGGVPAAQFTFNLPTQYGLLTIPKGSIVMEEIQNFVQQHPEASLEGLLSYILPRVDIPEDLRSPLTLEVPLPGVTPALVLNKGALVVDILERTCLDFSLPCSELISSVVLHLKEHFAWLFLEKPPTSSAVVLVLGKYELNKAAYALEQLNIHFNRNARYPVVVFHYDIFSPIMRDRLQLVNPHSKVSFVRLHFDASNLPAHVNPSLVNTTVPVSLTSRFAAHFSISELLSHPALLPYQYILRLDAAGFIDGPIVDDAANADVFVAMSRQKAVLSSWALQIEPHVSSLGLWDFVKQRYCPQSHLHEFICSTAVTRNPHFFHEDGRWNRLAVFTAFSAMDLSFFRQPAVSEFLGLAAAHGGCFYSGWSDSAVLSLAFALFAQPSQALYLVNAHALSRSIEPLYAPPTFFEHPASAHRKVCGAGEGWACYFRAPATQVLTFEEGDRLAYLADHHTDFADLGEADNAGPIITHVDGLSELPPLPPFNGDRLRESLSTAGPHIIWRNDTAYNAGEGSVELTFQITQWPSAPRLFVALDVDHSMQGVICVGGRIVSDANECGESEIPASVYSVRASFSVGRHLLTVVAMAAVDGVVRELSRRSTVFAVGDSSASHFSIPLAPVRIVSPTRSQVLTEDDLPLSVALDGTAPDGVRTQLLLNGVVVDHTQPVNVSYVGTHTLQVRVLAPSPADFVVSESTSVTFSVVHGIHHIGTQYHESQQDAGGYDYKYDDNFVVPPLGPYEGRANDDKMFQRFGKVIPEYRPYPAFNKTFLDLNGYIILEDVFTPEEADFMREAVLHFEGTGPPSPVVAKGTERIWNLPNKGQCFERALVHPRVLEVVEYLLGSDLRLGSFTSNIAGGNEIDRGLHIDVSHTAFYEGRSEALTANTIWMVEDFTETNGATQVVPGSHRWTQSGKMPPQYQHLPEEIIAVGKKGSVMVINGDIWHGGSVNQTPDRRVALLSLYIRSWLLPQQVHRQIVSQEVIERGPVKLQQLVDSYNQNDRLVGRLSPLQTPRL